MEGIKTNKEITVSKAINVSRNALWNLISTPGNLNNCHPYCSSNDVIQWDNESHVDRLVYLNGRTYIRKFDDWKDGFGYTLYIGEEGGYQSYVEWSLQEIDMQTSQLSITVHPYLLAGFPKFVSFLPYHFWIRPKLKNYLNSVISGFEYVATTGESVPRNHFGRHSWFS